MIPRLRMSPLDRTVERDGVSVTLSHAAMLTFEMLAWEQGRPVSNLDMLQRVYGPRDWSKRRFDSVFRVRTWYECRKAAAALGLRLEETGLGFMLVEGKSLRVAA